jgi:hypothetical protein
MPCRTATKAEGGSLAAPNANFEMDTEEIRIGRPMIAAAAPLPDKSAIYTRRVTSVH